MEKATSISLRGKDIRRAMNDIAAEKGRSVADLVAEALKQAYGAEIDQRLSFFKSNGNSNYRSETAGRDHE